MAVGSVLCALTALLCLTAAIGNDIISLQWCTNFTVCMYGT